MCGGRIGEKRMRILLTGAVEWTEEQRQEIRSLGNEIIYIQDERIPLREQGIDVACIEGVICNGLFLYNDIAEFKNLRYIQLTSAGLERVPLELIKRRGIKVYNAAGVYSVPMAELVLSGVLQIYKKSRFFYENQKRHCWRKHRELQELSGKTVCILGCGSVGTECAKRFKAFGCRVLGINRHLRADANYEEIWGIERLKEALPQSDIIVLALALTDETKHLMNREKFKLMKQGAIFVNVARGAVADTEALVKELPRLGGAVLDVFEEEPLSPKSALWDMESVFITPHNSFVGNGNRVRLQKMIIENLSEAEGLYR